MTLLDDVKDVVKRLEGESYIDVEEIADVVGAGIFEQGIFRGERRWGYDDGTVLVRRQPSPDHVLEEWVMVVRYIETGDNDGAEVSEVYSVRPRTITKYEWDRV